ncbi:hypothetical protein [Aureliella helgolandensis]|nr:hypothetical protein [Aureliella helgolandensis]
MKTHPLVLIRLHNVALEWESETRGNQPGKGPANYSNSYDRLLID